MSGAPTRRELLVTGTSAGVAGLAAVTLVRAGSGVARAATTLAPPVSEATLVHRLLSVELLLLFAYTNVLGSSVLTPHAERVVTPLHAHEEAHVRALRARLAVLGGIAPAPPANAAAADRDLARRSVGGRLGQLQGSHDAVDLLLAVERVVIGAYFVALMALEDPELITLGAQIMACEAQHEAILGELLYSGNAQMAVPYGLVQGVQ